MEGLQHFLCDEIPLLSLCRELNPSPSPALLETLVTDIVFHGSQEHGSTLLMEHLLQFPLPQTQRVSLLICLRPIDLFPNSVDILELIDEDGKVDSSLPIGEKSEMATLYDSLYARVDEIIQKKDMEISTAEFTFRIHLYSPSSPLVNFLYFPLEASSAAQRHLTSRSSHSFYAFILSSWSSLRTAKVSEIWARRSHEVPPVCLLCSPAL
jgi:hypothetical protein